MEKRYINILVVEDNPGDVKLVSEMFKECATQLFTVTAAGTVGEALKTLKSEKFDADGKVIGHEIKVHPALLALPKLQKDFGISLTDFNLTPAAESKAKSDEKTAETLADIFHGVGAAFKNAKGKPDATA